MPLPDGFEFIVNDAIPADEAWRSVNERTFEVTPALYDALQKHFGRPEQLRQAYADVAGAVVKIGNAFVALGEALALLQEGQRPPDPTA